jgi:hypothetical protein
MWNPAYKQKDPAALPIHTVPARWGSRPDPDGGWSGYEPDWHVLVVVSDPTDCSYPFWVYGWLPARDTTDGALAAEPFIWKTQNLNNARYDLTEAVVLPT